MRVTSRQRFWYPSREAHSRDTRGSTGLSASVTCGRREVILARPESSYRSRDHMRQKGSDLCSDMSFPAELLHGQMKTRGAINAVTVEQRHSRHLMGVTYLGQHLGNRRYFEEAECRPSVQFYVHASRQS